MLSKMSASENYVFLTRAASETGPASKTYSLPLLLAQRVPRKPSKPTPDLIAVKEQKALSTEFGVVINKRLRECSP